MLLWDPYLKALTGRAIPVSLMAVKEHVSPTGRGVQAIQFNRLEDKRISICRINPDDITGL